MRLDLLVYNIEYGRRADRPVIRKLDADVVGVLESYERLPEIAAEPGYPYYNTSLQLLSKYPILEPSGGDGLYALIEVEPGYVVPFFNVHLDYVAWGPRMLRNGHPVEAVIESENEVRTSAMEEPFAAMSELLEDGYPIFLTGDFNQPSSLDYVEETAGSRQEIPEPVAWPVSEKLFELGFRDTYREAHDDPVEDPGDHPDRSGERIDYVYAAGRRDARLEARRRARRRGRGDRGIAVDLRPPRGALDLRGDPGGDADAGRGRREPANGRRRDHGDQQPGADGQPGRDRAGGRRSDGSGRDARGHRRAAARRGSTPTAGTRGLRGGADRRRRRTRSPASRSTFAIRRRSSSSRPTGGATSAASRSRPPGRRLPPTAGTGSASTRRRPRTPRRTTT